MVISSPRQRKQSKIIIQSRKVFDGWFLMKVIIGTFVPRISIHVTKRASLINSAVESPVELMNACSTVSTIRTSVVLRSDKITSIMSDAVSRTVLYIFSYFNLYFLKEDKNCSWNLFYTKIILESLSFRAFILHLNLYLNLNKSLKFIHTVVQAVSCLSSLRQYANPFHQ